MDGVIAASGEYGVVAAVAVQDVDGGVAEDGVGVRRTVDVLDARQDVALGVVARAAADLGRGPVLPGQVHVDPGGAGAVVRQIAGARAAVQSVGPGPAHQGVVARTADEGVVAIQADEMVARGVAREHVAVGSVVAADEVLDADQRIAQGVVVRPAARLGRCPVLDVQVHGHPARAVAVIGEIQAKAAVDQVGPGPATQGVVAVPAEQRVVTGQAGKKVGRRVAGNAVAVTRADDVLDADEHVALGVAAGLGGAGEVDVHGRGAGAVIHGVATFLGVQPGRERCVRVPAAVQGVGVRAAAHGVVAVQAVDLKRVTGIVEIPGRGQIVRPFRAPDLDRAARDLGLVQAGLHVKPHRLAVLRGFVQDIGLSIDGHFRGGLGPGPAVVGQPGHGVPSVPGHHQGHEAAARRVGHAVRQDGGAAHGQPLARARQVDALDAGDGRGRAHVEVLVFRNQHVMPRAAVHHVARAGPDQVGAVAALERVIARSANEGVIPPAADQAVVPGQAGEHVVLVVADERVTIGRTREILDGDEHVAIGMVAAVEDSRVGPVVDGGQRGRDRAAAGLGRLAVLQVQVHIHLGLAQAVVRGVDALAAVQGVRAAEAHEQVVARTAFQPVGRRAPSPLVRRGERLVAHGTADERVIVGRADDAVDVPELIPDLLAAGNAGLEAFGLVAQVDADPLGRVPVADHVVVHAAPQHVSPGAALQGVVVVVAPQDVVAAAPDDQVMAVQTIELVGLVVADERVARHAVRAPNVPDARQDVADGVVALLAPALGRDTVLDAQVDVHGLAVVGRDVVAGDLVADIVDAAAHDAVRALAADKYAAVGGEADQRVIARAAEEEVLVAVAAAVGPVAVELVVARAAKERVDAVAAVDRVVAAVAVQ